MINLQQSIHHYHDHRNQSMDFVLSTLLMAVNVVVQKRDGLEIQIHPRRRYFYNYIPSNNKHLQIMIRSVTKLCCIFSCI